MRLAAFSHTIYYIYIYIYIYIYLNICWSERSTIRLTSLDPQIHLNKIPALMKTRMLSEDHGSKRSSIFFLGCQMSQQQKGIFNKILSKNHSLQPGFSAKGGVVSS